MKVLDCGSLAFVSSAGLRALLMLHKTMAKKGGLKLVGVKDAVREVLDMTGFTKFLDFE